MCRWFENKIEEDPDFFDDANSNNCMYCGTEAPDEVVQRPLYFVKRAAWVTISKQNNRTVLFENTDEEAVSVTNVHYIDEQNTFWGRAFGTRCGVNRDVQ